MRSPQLKKIPFPCSSFDHSFSAFFFLACSMPWLAMLRSRIRLWALERCRKRASEGVLEPLPLAARLVAEKNGTKFLMGEYCLR